MVLCHTLHSCIGILFSPAIIPEVTHKSLSPIRMKMDRCADKIILHWPIHWLYQRNRHETTLRNLMPQALHIIISHWKEQHRNNQLGSESVLTMEVYPAVYYIYFELCVKRAGRSLSMTTLFLVKKRNPQFLILAQSWLVQLWDPWVIKQ